MPSILQLDSTSPVNSPRVDEVVDWEVEVEGAVVVASAVVALVVVALFVVIKTHS